MTIGEGNLFQWLDQNFDLSGYNEVRFILSAGNQKGVGIGHLSRSQCYAGQFLKSHIKTSLMIIDGGDFDIPTTFTNNFDAIDHLSEIAQLNLEGNESSTSTVFIWDLPPGTQSDFNKPSGLHIWVTDLDHPPQNVDLWIVPWPVKLPATEYPQLSGPEWMPLGNLPTVNKEVQQNVISATFGGSDPLDLSFELWKKWQSTSFQSIASKYQLQLFLGPAYQGKLKAQKSPQENILLKFAVPDLNQELINSKLVLCCGGITPWALSKMGLEFVIIPSIDHEVVNAQRLEDFLSISLQFPLPQDPQFQNMLELKLNISPK